jgi:hypothetical protein
VRDPQAEETGLSAVDDGQYPNPLVNATGVNPAHAECSRVVRELVLAWYEPAAA